MERDLLIREYWEKCTPMSFVPEKWTYERKRAFKYDLADYMHDSFKFHEWSGKKVLEIGCGSGIDSLEFARNGAIVTATDMTENAVHLTRDLAAEAGLPATVVQTSATSLPFADGSFDCVYSYGVLHHIPAVDEALTEISRVLKDGGKVMVMLYHRDSLLHAYSIIYRYGIKEGLLSKGCTEQQLASRYSERFEGCPYTHVYGKEEAVELFSRWFTNVDIQICFNTVDTDRQRKVKLAVDDKWELGWHLILTAMKGKV